MEAVETIRFPVEGMTCGVCVNRIERTVRALPGVHRVRVDLRRETAAVTRDPALATDAALAEAVSAAGYAALIDAAEPVDERESRGLISRLLNRDG
jgi:Cu+-exporting ATPase